jgi:putative hemolysin
MRRSGFDLTFESELVTDFRLRPDALICLRDTDESFFLEFSSQSLARSQLTGFEAMAACSKPVEKYFETLKCVFRLHTIPAPEHLQEIVGNIEVAVESVRATGRLAEVIEEGTLEMAICRLPETEEIEAWCTKKESSPYPHLIVFLRCRS